ncbi:putative H(+)-transporting two-sector ATPase [Medicago truncatula]|uniref:F0F1-type ATP synthase, delta subunit n=1 Tax=Medicago truncatula TaxID=3880 RepID=G7JLC6_MEDTR|nr:ATP synthase delta chain, chloroplastic [Medicago truncatula]AES91015.1 F0F1-type ATP synthase, delta subunit [Medicago truncatula]RHN63357.1 putative H(+)-transporting two-sector ATPase [Medicago truncatula]
MASLQHTTASIYSKSIPKTTTTLTPKPILNLILSRTTFTSPKLKLSKTKPRRTGGGALGSTMNSPAAASYASALADLAKSNNTLDATTADIDKIEELFTDPKVFDYFSSPTVEDSTKRNLIAEFATSSSFQPHTQNFLNLLIEANRIDIILEIVKEFELHYNTLTDTELVVVTSVVKLESQHLAQIAKQVQKLTGAKNVRIKTNLDPSLVAGFTVRYGNSGSKFIDMSVKKKLEEIASQLDLGDIKLAV